MDLHDWILFLHLLSAFALVGGVAVYWALAAATRPAAPLLSQQAAAEIVRPTLVIVLAGTVGTVLFGIWLAIQVDEYQVWDPWILASLVLWGVSGGLGDQAGKAFTRAMDGGERALADRRRGLLFHTASSIALLVILILMIWKPGA